MSEVQAWQAWQALLARKRLAAASDALKTYGVSSEADVRVLQESDVRASDSTLKPLHRRILREWVKELDQPDCSAIQPGNTTTAASATSMTNTSKDWIVLEKMGAGVSSGSSHYEINSYDDAMRARASIAERLGVEYSLADLACYLCMLDGLA